MTFPRVEKAESVTMTPMLEKTVSAVRKNIPKMAGRFPRIGEDSGIHYEFCGLNDWVEGFWPGQLWLAYQVTGDAEFKDAASAYRSYFAERLKRPEGYIHDFGFMYSLSTVADFKITGNVQAQEVAVRAAEILAGRYNKKGKFIQAWNENERSLTQKYTNRGKMIIDCLENLGLLCWASRVTGRDEFVEIAHEHARSTETYLIRDDYGTGHTFNFDPDTGKPQVITTAQGFADDSCWARGQAWAVHGFACMFENTGEQHYLEISQKLADHAIARLPEDGVPIWDFDLPKDLAQHLDSSAAAIFAAGFLMLERHVSNGTGYGDKARKILQTLGSTQYSVLDVPEAEGLIVHGASHVKNGREDNMLPYGDYFFMEAQMRDAGFTEFFW